MKFLVTGGAGFIGSHLVDHLLSKQHEVVVIDNFSTGLWENLQPYGDQIQLFEASLCNLEAVCEAMQGVDYVFHEGAMPSVPRSIQDPITSHHSNVTGTINVLFAAKENGVKRLIYAASSSAYGDVDVDKKHESLAPQPISPYGVMKLSGEYYCKSFYASYGLETVCLRYFNVFGPRQNPKSAYTGVMAIFIPLMLQGKQPTIYGDGTATRDFTYIDNVVHANMLALEAENVVGESINVACGENHSVKHIVDTINQILGTEIEPIFAEERKGDIRHSCALIEKARTRLGFEPPVSFAEGVARTIDWYRQNISC